MSILEAPPVWENDFSRNRVRWTRDDCRILVDRGVLPDGARFELIDGDIVRKMGQNEPHAYVLMRLLERLVEIFGFAFLRAQLPIAVSDMDEPEPDIAVTVQPARTFLTQGTPGASDVCLVVEVSDTTLRGDRTVKTWMYARAGIPEYWIVDVTARQLIVHRLPGPDGYGDVTVHAESDAVAPLTAPASTVRIADILP
jgi:Uma2 family endonuclease